MATNGSSHGNSYGISLCRGGVQSGNYSSVLINLHGINLVSEGSYPMEEVTYNIDSHTESFEIGNNIVSSGIPSLDIPRSGRQPIISIITINISSKEHA